MWVNFAKTGNPSTEAHRWMRFDPENRATMVLGDEIEVFGPGADFFTMTLTSMRDAETGEPLTAAPHPQQMLAIPVDHPVGPQYMFRKRTSEK